MIHFSSNGENQQIWHIYHHAKYHWTDGRYTWRHNQVLRALAHGLEMEWVKKKGHKEGLHFISFRKEGQKEKAGNLKPQELLASAKDFLVILC